MVQMAIYILFSIVVLMALLMVCIVAEVRQLQQDKRDLKNRMYGMAKQRWYE